MSQTQAATPRCRACSRALSPAVAARRYCAGCLERLAALDPQRRHGALAFLRLGANIVLIVGSILLVVFGLAVVPIWLVLLVGPAGLLSYFIILPAGAAFGAALEQAGLRVPARKRKVM